jgi:hypothetical protein
MKSCQSQDDSYGIERTAAIIDCEWLNKSSVLLVAGLKKMEMICHGGLGTYVRQRNTVSAVSRVNNAHLSFGFYPENHVSEPFAGTCGELLRLEG